MADTGDAVTLSKSARKRANRKAREAGEVEEEAPSPAPAPKATPKATPKAPPKAASKAEAKAAPKSEPKAKAKASEPKAAPAPKEAPEPKAKQPAAKSQGKAGAKAKPKAKPEPEEEKPAKEPEPFIPVVLDDGKGGEWATASGLTKKQERQKERREEDKRQQAQMKSQGIAQAKANQYIPGLAPPEVQLAAQAKAKAKSAPVGTIAVVSAAAAANKDKEPEKTVVDNSTTATVKVPEAKIGRVVGPKGGNIIMIKEKTGVKTIDISGDICTIVGKADEVALAEHAVRQLIDKGYMSLAYDDFVEEGVQVHPSVFPDLIGQKGAIIQVIKKEAKCEIDIPPTPKTASTAPKKYKVGIAGSKTAVEKGKEIVNSIAMYGYHEITHPGTTHQELEVEEWRYRFLIGSKGSEMRHIQNNYKVKVNIPREFSANDKVVISGEPRDVERAIKYIEKVLYEESQPKGRGAEEKAVDPWGEEGEVEDWMAPYMYQRR